MDGLKGRYTVMIQVSAPDNIKDPSAAYVSCAPVETMPEAITIANRVRFGPRGGIFTRCFIKAPDGSECYHCER